MTDNEIIATDKAIETLRYEIDEECHCDYIADEIRLLIEQYENTRLNLREAQLEVNRQKAEIERLERIEAIGTKTIETQSAEIERLQEQYKFLESNSLIFKGGIDYFKSEAIKEFAERIKEATFRYYDSDIDNLVKEMTEKE